MSERTAENRAARNTRRPKRAARIWSIVPAQSDPAYFPAGVRSFKNRCLEVK